MKLLPAIIAMAALVVASNVLVQFLVWDGFLTWGAFTYPFAFLVTDLTNRFHGAAAARKVVLAGFVTGVICSLIGTQVMLEFGPAVVLRVAVASGTAFLMAQLLDVAVFDRLRQGRWWRAPLVSSLISSVLDTALFFAIAFSAPAGALFPPGANAAVAWAQEAVPLLGAGAPAPFWVSMGIADFSVKLAIAVVALMPFRLILTQWMRNRA